MIDSDTDMSDCYSDDGLLAYKTPYPPSLPANEPDWEQSKAYGSRRTPTGFAVRKLNFNDPTGQGKSKNADWPFEQRLGYPSTREGWHPLVFKYGLQVLDAAGFINFETTKPHTYNPNGYWESKRNRSGTLAERIHPVLRKEMWHLFTDEEYKTITPALLLATAILDDPGKWYEAARRQPRACRLSTCYASHANRGPFSHAMPLLCPLETNRSTHHLRRSASWYMQETQYPGHSDRARAVGSP